MSSALIYALRFCPKLSLPVGIQDNIARLRIVPAAYKPVRQVKQRFVPKRKEDAANWREHVLTEYVRKVRETEDPQYDEIFGIFNKLTTANLSILTDQALAILNQRDKEFRLRVTTLLFDKAIRGSYFAGVMADLAYKLNNSISEVSEDLEMHVKMFTTLYDMKETLVYPSLEDPAFGDKLIAWSKQKDIRRGYARFLTHLYTRNLVSGQVLHLSMNHVISDLSDTVVQPKSDQSEENATQYADFLFEISKLLPVTAVELRGLMYTNLNEILMRNREAVSSLNMRSRFKLEDTVKCVQAS